MNNYSGPRDVDILLFFCICYTKTSEWFQYFGFLLLLCLLATDFNEEKENYIYLGCNIRKIKEQGRTNKHSARGL